MRFCEGKAFLIVLLAWCFAMPLSAWKLGETINVQTLDGHFFPNAELMSVDAGGITICYMNQQKEPVLRGITFDRLPMELRLRYGYDPEKFATYQKGVGTYRPPAVPESPQKTQSSPVQKGQSQTNRSDEDNDDTPSLTIAPWNWYYSRPKYIVPRFPVKPPVKPGPHRPGPPKPPFRPYVPGGRPVR